ncbi:MAG: hypothetical protein WC484_03400 [Candidatus Omnitrophota bacterium]
MKLIKLLRKTLILSIVLLVIFPMNFLHAAKVESSSKGFSIKPSQDWIELPLPFQGVVVSYGKKGTLATFHITERNLDGTQTVDQLKWEDLFSPEFKSIDIRTQNTTLLGGEKARFCVYTLKPGAFKKTMEGKLPAKYINYVLIHQGKLFSITFKDTEDGFALTYPAFLAVIRTLRFDAPKLPTSQRKPT